MSTADAEKWNARYLNNPQKWHSQPRSFLSDNLQFLPSGGLALDVAMGIGSQAAFLSQHGFRVVGIDISFQAVLRAKRNHPVILAAVGDLLDLILPRNRFDIILNLYYLQRSLVSQFAELLKPGGIVFFETLTRKMSAVKEQISTSYLLEQGEALSLFKKWDILYYREGWITSDNGHQKSIASIIARNPIRDIS